MFNNNNNNKSTNRRRNRRGRARKRGGNNNNNDGANLAFVRNVSKLPIIISPTHRCILKYVSHISGFTDPAQYGSISYRANGLYDPSESVSDTSQPDGFTSLATLYNNYIVNNCQIDLIVSNREDFAINIAMGWFPGSKTIGSAAEAIDVGEGPFGMSRMLSAKGGVDRVRLVKRVYMPEFWNSKYYYGDSSFQATTSSNPSTLAVIVIAAVSPSGSTLTNGVSINVRMTFDVTFTGRKGTDQVTSSSLEYPQDTKVELFPGRSQPVREIISVAPFPEGEWHEVDNF